MSHPRPGPPREESQHASSGQRLRGAVRARSPLTAAGPPRPSQPGDDRGAPGAGLEAELERFDRFGTATQRTLTPVELANGRILGVATFVNQFWTSRQRAASRLHEISYRACFKPQLPRFFVERLTRTADVVYDPFMGRGTTLLESALLGRVPWGCDANPLAATLLRPRLAPPRALQVAERLRSIDLSWSGPHPPGLQAFYHPTTLDRLLALRQYLLDREARGRLDPIDDWIRMVAVNRLTGHSPGFFSVYTLPPNQAVSVVAQQRINARRGQVPPERDVVKLLVRKSNRLLGALREDERRRLRRAAGRCRLVIGSSERTEELPDRSVDLVVTSPPFLNVVDYVGDNWLRAWFCGVDLSRAPLTVTARIDRWEAAMSRTFEELQRLLVPGGYVAFEVGEVRCGRLRLEETIARCGAMVGLAPRLVLLNDQTFTKTSNCWGVTNRRRGTNTNRVVVFRAPR